MNVLSELYGRVAGWRRAWYSRPARRQRLTRPVISVGNLVVGGSGKTPTVAYLARRLQGMGERPVVLSRGYGRRRPLPGVVVISDGIRVLENAGRAGDEPLMLARALPGVPVLVARERRAAGALAEEQFGATVHLLDDGFQHLRLRRDLDLVLVSPGDLDEQVLPAGRLREPLTAAAEADAIIVRGTAADAEAVAARLQVARVFRLETSYARPRAMDGSVVDVGTARAFAVAGIAVPARFFAALRDAGVALVGERAFRDHHWYTRAEVEAIGAAARAAGATMVVTTEKDAVRLEALVGDNRGGVGTAGLTWAVLPMDVRIEPEPEFATWLAARLRTVRERRGGAA